jgi:hypothetical protein
MTEQDEPQVGDFILLFDDESEAAGEPPILLVRVTEDGFDGVGEAELEEAERLEARARFLAHEQRARAWRLVGEGYKLLLPYAPVKDVH